MMTMTTNSERSSVYSTVIPGSVNTVGRTAVRRSANPSASPELAYKGCYTLYECIRRGRDIAPMGPCLGYRAISTSGSATPYVYCNYTEIVARIDAIAAGLQRLHLLNERNDSGMLLVIIFSCVILLVILRLF
jgi:long-chain acyl-CoA synthetase